MAQEEQELSRSEAAGLYAGTHAVTSHVINVGVLAAAIAAFGPVALLALPVMGVKMLWQNITGYAPSGLGADAYGDPIWRVRADDKAMPWLSDKDELKTRYAVMKRAVLHAIATNTWALPVWLPAKFAKVMASPTRRKPVRLAMPETQAAAAKAGVQAGTVVQTSLPARAAQRLDPK